jgi:short subunit dehydrogenase-like uncharacterized protein
LPESSAEITLFGATGFTGQIIARALAREGLSFRIAGRSEDKLTALAQSLPVQPAILTADASQPTTLPQLFQNTRLLINCAGPFTDLGERVISQAALAGVHYLDITNELGYVFRARTYHELARKTGAALVPACGFEVAFADCAADLTAAGIPGLSNASPLDTLNLVYVLHGAQSSKGTRRSAIRTLATSWIAYRDGTWRGQIPGGSVHHFVFPGESLVAYTFPSSESITIPAHIPTRRVDAWMAASTAARFWAPIAIPLLARMSRSILRGTILSLAARGGLPPVQSPVETRQSPSPFVIYLEAKHKGQAYHSAISGQDPYTLTAQAVTYAARKMLASDYHCAGLLAPSQAFDPAAFIAFAQSHWGLTWQPDLS